MPSSAGKKRELLPHTSRIMDRVTVLRSLTHPYPLHGVAYATTGLPTIDLPRKLNPRDGRHWPCIGSVVDYLEKRRGRDGAVPANFVFHGTSTTGIYTLSLHDALPISDFERTRDSSRS